MTRTLAVCVFLACGMTLCAPLLARAEEPCRADGATVVCQRAGFDALVGKLLDARASAAKCVLESEVRTADAEVLKAAQATTLAELDAARAEVDRLKARRFPRGRMLEAVGLGTAAGLAGAGAAAVSSNTASAVLAGVSLTSAATAVVLVLME